MSKRKVKLKVILENFNTDLWGHHLVIPGPEAEMFVEGDNRRVICTINNNLQLQSALMPKKDGDYFILLNQENRRKLGIKEGDEVEIELEKDKSEFGLPLPESFQVLLDQDEEGNRLFRALTMGKQRSLIYIVGKVKNVDSQLSKGMAILDHLKEKQGKLDFKQLNEKIKEYNQMRKLKR